MKMRCEKISVWGGSFLSLFFFISATWAANDVTATEATTSTSPRRVLIGNPFDGESWSILGDISAPIKTSEDSGPATAYLRDEAKDLINLSDAFFQAGKPVEALAYAENALEIDPDNDFILFKVAQLKTVNRAFQSAAIYWQQLVDREPDNISHLSSLASTLIRSRQHKDAAKPLEKILAQEPNHLFAKYHSAIIEVEQGNLTEARTLLQGRSSKEVGQLAKWLSQDADIITGLTLKKNYNLLAQSVMGHAVDEAGAAKQDIEGTAQRLRVFSEKVWVVYQSGLNREWSVATKVAGKLAKEGCRSPGILVELGFIRYMSGQKAKAVTFMQGLQSAFPEATYMHSLMGLVFLEEGEYEKGRASFAKALEADSDDQIAGFGLACSFYLVGEIEQAEARFKQINEENDQILQRFAAEPLLGFINKVLEDEKIAKIIKH